MDKLKLVKLKALEKDLTLTELASRVGISRENMYHHIKNNNREILLKIEKILELKENPLTK
ncbi:MAG: hypothetical protein WBG30_07680 [Psychrilyobacter sp.]|uniref:hypothetical protein n=1 Tax=Psychrilyobacter sp. TaxID=2586924 RepID=UPI003C7251E0